MKLLLRSLLVSLAIFAAVCGAEPETPDAIAKEILAPLIDPRKVATLKGDRPANARLYKVLFWLEIARRAGGDSGQVIDAAQAEAGYAGSRGAAADRSAILWSRKKLEDFGCFTAEGMAKLRKGGAPEITRGEHAGDRIALDHVLPRSVVPELEARFYNLEAVPSRLNARKSDDIGQRELALARRWREEGLLSRAGLEEVVRRLKPKSP